MKTKLDRRHFLHASAALGAALPFSTAAAADAPAKPVRRILACGGGAFKTPDRDRSLLKYLITLTGKPQPLVCLIPTANADQPDTIVSWYETMNELDCRPRHLKLINNSTELKGLEKQMLALDAFFVGGGNTLNMLAVWKAQGVDAILRRAYEQGKVLAGTSAGMICWFEQGVSDSRPERLTMVEGLGFLKGSACPHYDHKDREGKRDRQEAYHRLLKAREISEGLAADDGVGFLFENEALVGTVGDTPKGAAVRVKFDGAAVVEEPIKVRNLKG